MKRVVLLVVTIALIIGCSSSDDDGNGGGTDTFDRSALLVHTADNIIIPAFQDLKSKISSLNNARDIFLNDLTENNLESLSIAWLNAYKVWQHVQMFNLGEARNLGGGEDRGFVSFFNIYPVTVTDIENAASTGTFDLNTANYHDAQGFPGLDFLIHGIASGDGTPLDKFTSNSNATGYINYLTAVSNQIEVLNDRILADWENSFRDTFVNNTQTGINGSFNQMVNDLIFFYEKGFRAEKIGIPVGNFSNEPLPEKVEAFYKKDVSKELALEALTVVENVFEGKSYNSNSTGPSFKTYLEFLERQDLVTTINGQFDAARSSINTLNNSFYQQVLDNNNQLILTYDVIQAAVPTLKTDMRQLFGVTIDFFDSDGD